MKWHTVLIETLKTEASNFVLNHSLHWKPVECPQQCCCTCMPGITEGKSAEAYSVCWQGYQQKENYSSLT